MHSASSHEYCTPTLLNANKVSQWILHVNRQHTAGSLRGPGTIKRMIALLHVQHTWSKLLKNNTFQCHCNIKTVFILLQLIFLRFYYPKTSLIITPKAEAIASAETSWEKKNQNRCIRADQSGKREWEWGWGLWRFLWGLICFMGLHLWRYTRRDHSTLWTTRFINQEIEQGMRGWDQFPFW